jgi:hypothetical protein
MGSEDLGAEGFVVPVEGALDHGGAAHGVLVVEEVLGVPGVVGGKGEPRGAPEELVVEAGVGAVEGADDAGEAVAVLAPEAVREVEELLRAAQELGGVGAVDAAEGDRGGRERGGRLGRHVGAVVGGVDLVGGPGRRHVLRPLPAVVVAPRAPHLHPELVRLRVRLQEIIRPPPQTVQRIPQLPRPPQLRIKLTDPPRHHRHRIRHRQPKLHIIPRIVISPCQVNLHKKNQCQLTYFPDRLVIDYKLQHRMGSDHHVPYWRGHPVFQSRLSTGGAANWATCQTVAGRRTRWSCRGHWRSH